MVDIKSSESLDTRSDITPMTQDTLNNARYLASQKVSGTKSLVIHSTNTDTALVKNDFFITSYPSLNDIITHVDTVINRIKPVTFKPPSYLDESLVKPTEELVYDAPKTESQSKKSFFVSIWLT